MKIAAGEVTIFWQYYLPPGAVKESYAVTYSFDEEGNCLSVSDEREIQRKEAEKAIKFLEKKDINGLLGCFCDEIQKNYSEDIRKMAEEAFEFLGGEILRYEHEKNRNAYQVHIYFINAWEEHPECEGICSIQIVNREKEEIFIEASGLQFPEFPKDEEDENQITPEPTPSDP